MELNVTEQMALVLGGQNLFDAFPQKNPNEGVPAFNGLPYPENSPVGFNGGSWYLRMIWRRDG